MISAVANIQLAAGSGRSAQGKAKRVANVGIDHRTFRYRELTFVQWSFDANPLTLADRKLPRFEYDKSLKRAPEKCLQ